MTTISIKSLPTIVCGPSGVGKGTLLRKVKELMPNTFGIAVSHTTRNPRNSEQNGIHYHFTSKSDFEQGIKNNEFLEYANVHGNYYGTSFAAIEHLCKQNLICLLEIDVQGAQIIKQKKQGFICKYLFISCTSPITTLHERLHHRHTENEQQIQSRLKTAKEELLFLEENADFFDCVLINDDLLQAAYELASQFKNWYPWIIADRNLSFVKNANCMNKEQKENGKSIFLLFEDCSANEMFNALQNDVQLFDVRSENEFKIKHIQNAVNVENISNNEIFSHLRIFCYGHNLSLLRKLFEYAQNQSNIIQFSVMTDKQIRIFFHQYSFLCKSGEKQRRSSVHAKYPHCVLFNKLYIGDGEHASNAMMMNDLNITHIVNVTNEEWILDSKILEQDILYCQICLEDSSDCKSEISMVDHFQQANKFIADAVNDNKRVLIHCAGGKSRSSTFCLAYLMYAEKLSLVVAYGMLSNCRPKIFPNDAFLKQLGKYEEILFGSSTIECVRTSFLRNRVYHDSKLKSWGI